VDLFHITTRDDWERARERGEYRAPSLAAEGFIHLSRARQWHAVANRFYRGRAGLVLLAIRADRLRHEVRDEPADGDRFPHLYGPLEVDAVVAVFDLPVAADGAIEIPPALRR
jgi:glutathione S-transferase